MPYARTTWQDYPATATPITAASLNNIEAFLASISTAADAWTSYTPTLTNCTSPITAAKYSQIGKTVGFYVVLTLTGAQVSGLVGISLPVTAAGVMRGGLEAVISDASPAALYPALAFMTTTTRVDVYAQNAGGTYLSGTATSSTIPVTFASGDVIYVAGQYEAA
jgi:hypothetical protein